MGFCNKKSNPPFGCIMQCFDKYASTRRNPIGGLCYFGRHAADTFLSNSGPLTTHILQNTRNTRSTSFHASFLFSRNGTGKILSHTIRNATTKRSARYSDRFLLYSALSPINSPNFFNASCMPPTCSNRPHSTACFPTRIVPRSLVRIPGFTIMLSSLS